MDYEDLGSEFMWITEEDSWYYYCDMMGYFSLAKLEIISCSHPDFLLVGIF